MKFLSILLSFTIFVVSVKPCSDGLNIEGDQQEELNIAHDHQEDTDDDSCPITATYQPIYRFDFYANIWQPPQIIRARF